VTVNGALVMKLLRTY